MAGDGGQPSRSLREQLFGNASRFTFLQAVRLLESMRRDRTPPGEGVHPRHELVLFRHDVRFDFQGGDVEDLALNETPANEPLRMTVNVLGLTGSMGPLPHHISEQVLSRMLSGDRASQDFLDIFNHRLISLLYRALKKYRPALDKRGPDGGRVATVLFALAGLGTKEVRDRMGIPDRTLLPYTGFLAMRHRPAVGLERVVEDCFGVGAKLLPFQGRWYALQPDDQTRIGVTGQNQIVGRGAVLGRRIWDQGASVELRLGPMSFARFLSFLPSGHAYKKLVETVRFYTGDETGFTFRLLVAKKDIPALRVSKSGGAFLGRTSWVTRHAGARNCPGTDGQVTVVGRR